MIGWELGAGLQSQQAAPPPVSKSVGKLTKRGPRDKSPGDHCCAKLSPGPLAQGWRGEM